MMITIQVFFRTVLFVADGIDCLAMPEDGFIHQGVLHLPLAVKLDKLLPALVVASFGSPLNHELGAFD